MLTSIVNLLTNFAAACQPGAGGGFLGFPTWYQYLEGEIDTSGKCSVVFDFPNDFGAILLAIFEIILRIGALAAVGFVIYGGFQYILSHGEPDRLKAARGTIINAIVGLVITLFATAFVNLIAGSLT